MFECNIKDQHYKRDYYSIPYVVESLGTNHPKDAEVQKVEGWMYDSYPASVWFSYDEGVVSSALMIGV